MVATTNQQKLTNKIEQYKEQVRKTKNVLEI